MSASDMNQETHCPRLGHTVTLAYCIHESIDLPCRLVFQCWEGRVPIRDHLLALYSSSQLEALQKPTSKLSAIVDSINQAGGKGEIP